MFQKNTSWESSSSWYEILQGKEGSYYHRTILIPGALALLDLHKGDHLLDLGCGEGIVERHIPAQVTYTGVDLSPSLLKKASSLKKQATSTFLCKDISKPLPLTGVSHVLALLSLQNVSHPDRVIHHASSVLKKTGKLLLILNHPCFRIPKRSSWESTPKKLYRKLEGYLSLSQHILHTHPSKKNFSPTTLSVHFPLQSLFSWLSTYSFLVQELKEWISPKKSMGSRARAENDARREFPLFMAVLAIKK